MLILAKYSCAWLNQSNSPYSVSCCDCDCKIPWLALLCKTVKLLQNQNQKSFNVPKTGKFVCRNSRKLAVLIGQDNNRLHSALLESFRSKVRNHTSSLCEWNLSRNKQWTHCKQQLNSFYQRLIKSVNYNVQDTKSRIASSRPSITL